MIADPVYGKSDVDPPALRAKEAVSAYEADRAGFVAENTDPVT
jgi:hypothetical protein